MTHDEALQAVVAGEHAAVYAYGVVGGRVRTETDRRAARAGWETHRSRRDAATALLVEAQAPVPPPAPAYDLGGQVSSPGQARELAARVELATCGPYADLVGASEPARRHLAASWLASSAAASVAWGGEPTSFPGLAGPA